MAQKGTPRETELISEIESRLDEPTAHGLAAALSRVMRDGLLRPGDRLPPIRRLAHELTLSPTTVSAAWATLTRAGTIRTDGRRGTVVVEAPSYRQGRYRQAFEQQTDFALDLSTGVPDETLLPGLERALTAVRTAGTPRSYLDDPVLPELREVLLETWPYRAPALSVVDGAMDGLELVIRVALRYGDRVLVEHPTFPPLVDLLESVGAEVVGVPLDEQGLLPEALGAALAGPVRAVFLQPRGHNPTGVSTTPERVRVLASVLEATEVLVVEDDATSAMSAAADVSLGTCLPHRVVHVRSYSKSHGPDLRLAAMSGPEPLMAAVEHARQLGQGWSSRLLQRVLFQLLTDPVSRREVEDSHDEYGRRRAAFVSALARAGVRVGGREGLNVWVPVHDEPAALMRLAARGIGVAPGRPFQVLEDGQGHVRITTGLLRERVEEVAREVAAAARTSQWGGAVR